MTAKEPLLLHLCCAPCSLYPLRELAQRHEVTLYFYNPNIHPETEYRLRMAEVEQLAAAEGLPLIVGEYDAVAWLKGAEPWKDEPEKGARCAFCFSHRLSAAARAAAQLGIARFGTVLSVSSKKDVVMINRAGNAAAEKYEKLSFLSSDWKKNEGAKIAVRLSNERGYRRQDYCGCAYSKKKEALRRSLRCAL